MKTLLASIFFTLTLPACSKNGDDAQPAFVISGLWEGKIGTGSVTPSGQYVLSIKPGGVIERVNTNKSVTATGNWQLSGNNFTATYNYSNGTVVNVTGTIDKEENKLIATWENNGNEQGTLFIHKQ